MPQPTTATAPPTDYVSQKIAQAKELERERAALQERIAANRRQLRDMATSGDLNAEQKRWLLVFYPEKEKGERRSSDEIEATRKAREAARKDGNSQD